MFVTIQACHVVAPYVGAWIETSLMGSPIGSSASHPTWVRGLKLNGQFELVTVILSHPTWVRGLKHRKVKRLLCPFVSHPTWVRGLKPLGCFAHCKRFVSHPTWVRGLKQGSTDRLASYPCVAPYVGAWIETPLSCIPLTLVLVAPYVGAWIETNSPNQTSG